MAAEKELYDAKKLAEVKEIEAEARRVRDQGGDPFPLFEKAMKIRKEYGLIEDTGMAYDDV